MFIFKHNDLIKTIFVLVFIFFLFNTCTIIKTEHPIGFETALIKVNSSKYPDFYDDMEYDGLEYSIKKSLLYLSRVPEGKTFRFDKDFFNSGHIKKSLTAFLQFIENKPSGTDLKRYICSNYLIYRSAGNKPSDNILFTGYYEPSLQGSLNKTSRYRFPLYGRPNDLIKINLSLFAAKYKGESIVGRYDNRTVVPYYERREIENKDLFGKRAKAIAWLKDPVDIFFLQIQGSGKIYLDNGDILNIHYNSSNGQPYKSIGKLLIDTGKINRSAMSMQKIRSYLKKHPQQIQDILNYNPSYVFFQIEKDGPMGYLDVKLTPGRSLALDRRLFPPAGLAYIETKKPLINGDGRIEQWLDFSRFVLNQDTGGVIEGPGRADLFWGNDEYAQIAAGHMQHKGNLYFLVLKPDA